MSPARKKTTRKSSGQSPAKARAASGTSRARSRAGGGGGGRASGRRPASAGGARARRLRRARLYRWARRAALAILAVGFLTGLVASRWVIGLDRIVTQRFEGRRFSVPSRVLSAPGILYPGLDWQRVDLRGTLVRLGYREAGSRSTLPPGYFRWEDRRVRVHLRAFDHPSRPEPSRNIRIDLAGSQIESIRELPRGREVGAVLLEPEQVGAYYGLDREQRELVRLEDVPRHMIDAILAVEDQRFETHHGIDLRRIGGALLVNLRAGGVRQGASTLTQQLVKNFFLTPERTLTRKAQEAVMAVLVESRYDKPAILQAYLNEIYLGQRGATAVHGVGEAAHLYFGKRVADVTVAEAALLAAIIQSPNGISPFRDPERATQRRDLVLALMHAQGRIDDATLDRARREPMQVAAVTPDPGEARYYLDALRRQLPEVYDEEALAAEGLHIYSTLDLRLQRLAADVLVEGLERLEEHYPRLREQDPARRLQGCIVALRPQTGEVLALVGGRSYAVSQFDRCTQARRPAGSVFKPFVYVAALERPGRGRAPRITLAGFLDDSPLEVPTSDGVWRPENIDHEFRGRVPVRTALERSLNVPAARLGQEVGIARVIDTARRLGITSPLPPVPSLALGTGEVSPIEMARAYATIANGGVRTWPHTFEDVVDASGQTLARRKLALERVVDPATAYLATSLLEGVVDRGTAVGLRRRGLRGPIAAKTGTSDDEHDMWFAGFTPELVVVVWVGFDEPRSLGLQSSQVALPLWARFVKLAEGPSIRGGFRPPPGIERAWVDPTTGAIALSGCPERREEVFLEGTLPDGVCLGSGEGDRWTKRENRRRGLVQWLRDVL